MLTVNDRIAWRGYALLALLALAIMLPGLTTLPPVDRDEPRYAQAARQMIESGDYADIYFQNEPRYKKPVGIYWLQSASALLFGEPPYDEIWPYRLPSLFGAILAVLITAWGTSRLAGGRTGLLAGVILAIGTLINIEARLAKTDAVMLAAIAAAQFALAMAYSARGLVSGRLALLFWLAQAVGILIKGPVAPFVSALTVATLWFADRDLRWFRALRPLPGLALCAAITAPWLIWIGMKSGGAFYAESAGHDFFGKIFTGQDRGFLPPGYYALLFAICFAPGAWLALRGLGIAWRYRHEDKAMRFMLAWIVPLWLAHEIVFTKLPHYVLPAWPALAFLAARYAARASKRDAVPHWAWRLVYHGISLAGFGVIAAWIAVPFTLGEAQPVTATLLMLAAVACFLMQWRWQLRKPRSGLLWAVPGAMLFFPALFGFLLPAMKPLWISTQAAETFLSVRPCAFSRLVTSGHNEPSLVFLAGTSTLSANGVDFAAATLNNEPCTVAMIDDREAGAFASALHAIRADAEKVGAVRGFNYNGGGWKNFSFYVYRFGLHPGFGLYDN